ncbi:MAG: hypothetical protein NTY01_22235 [Verrucomicrobia bacterium]|nr:hypothetical protein [Verrucomicrobiota bacterium]
MNRMTRRTFISSATVACAAPWLRAEEKPAATSAAVAGLDFPLMDFHVHLDKSTIDAVLALPQARGVKFGIVEHAGTKENDYPIVLSNDEELKRQLDMLAGKPVFRGVQAEWIDWTNGFSKKSLAQLDYVLTDTMTFPGKDGRRTKLWLKDVESLVEMADKQAFMDRFVDWHVKIISEQPIDILANTSWLPVPLAADYDAFWTPARVQKVVDAAVKHRVALEISSSYKLPRLPFLKIAKAAGVKFSFGSNGRYPKMGLLDYSIATAKELGLKRSDMFVPAADGQKAVQRWKRA